MGSVKPWQVVLFIAALASLVFAAWNLMGGGDVKLKDQLYLLDVTTGDLYVYEKKGNAGISIPAKHPETGKRTLVNVRKDDAGQWTLVRSERVLSDIDGDAVAVLEGGVISNITNENNPKTYKRPSL